jgi:hypothetical protein
MPQAWQVPTGDDLWQVVSRSLIEKTNEDSEGGNAADNDLNENLDDRAGKAVDHAVAEIRGAIEAAGRYPVSVTAGGVPPEAFQFALAIAGWRLCAVNPSLVSVLLADGGSYAPLRSLYTEAQKWIESVRAGKTFTLPDDPTGVDYLTEVDDENPAISGVKWGDSLADDDEYAAGITEDGIVVSRLSQNMNTQ